MISFIKRYFKNRKEDIPTDLALAGLMALFVTIGMLSYGYDTPQGRVLTMVFVPLWAAYGISQLAFAGYAIAKKHQRRSITT